MDKKEILIIFPSFGNIEVVKQTLPSIIEETKKNDAALIVHDSTTHDRDEKWQYLQSLNKNKDFFLLLSDNLSMAHARNMCLELGQQLYAPDYICMIEDDHGFHPGFVHQLLSAMKKYYGKISPNGLRYGLFTGCKTDHFGTLHACEDEDGNTYPDIETPPHYLGGVNSCFRAAPTQHWNNVLKGYDTDEYLISNFQTKNLNQRNYNKGFTKMVVADGRAMFEIECIGRGTTAGTVEKLFDLEYTASDARSQYIGKDPKAPKLKAARSNSDTRSVFDKIIKKITK